GADELDAAVVCPLVGVCSGERRQEAVMDVDDPVGEVGEEAGRQDLHVAGEDDQVDLADHEVELCGLGPVARLRGDRDVVVGNAPDGGGLPQVGVVGDHYADVRVQVAGAVAP